RKGNEMAFVTLEDIQSTCDVVVFPRTWEKTRHLWKPGRILVVGGKVDTGRRDTPSLLCDWAKPPEELTVPVEQTAAASRPSPDGSAHRSVSSHRPAKPVQEAPLPVQTAQTRPHVICVTLTRSGKQEQDVKTLRQIHSLLVNHSGQDRFTIRLTGGASKPIELAFPNDTTHYCPELREKLTAIVGAEAVQVK
ncbi:MAG: hypothetical protein DRI48_08555, partial [Chloroflexi bacterium]